ncbi:energy-coupling factor transporter transmembrane component T [Pseudoneobacillus sp. C159]
MKSRFSTFHPMINFSYYLGSIFIIMLFLHPLFLLVGVAFLLIIHFFHDRFQSLKRWLPFMVITWLLIFLLNPLFNERGRHLLFEVFGHRVTLEATLYGGISAFSILGVMMLFVSYNEIMTPNKLLFLFAKFLPQFAILLMLTLRFIPLMRRRLTEISMVQQSKGISVKQGSFKERIKKGMHYVQVLITFSLEEAIQTADSMKARGYGQGKRTSYEYYRMQNADKFALFILFIFFLVILIARFFGYGTLTIYPLLEPIYLQSPEIFVLILYAIFISFPLFVQLGETIRWRILN